ncbi:hypothetical protein L9F63_003679, partial [Diploptera punctata]
IILLKQFVIDLISQHTVFMLVHLSVYIEVNTLYIECDMMIRNLFLSSTVC